MPTQGRVAEQAFTHAALFYESEEEFLAGTLAFIHAGLAADEPVLAAVSERKIGLLEGRLEGDAARVRFVDMARLGRNPARIIPVWRDFLAQEGAERRPVRGIGEPVWPGRTAAELTERDHHESLLNLAFAEARGFTLMCPYDAHSLTAEVLDAARRNHPLVAEHGERRQSTAYEDPRELSGPLDDPLPPPAADPAELGFQRSELSNVRRFVWAHARAAGLGSERQADLAVAVNELATNSVRYGADSGTVRVWRDGDALVCEVADSGRVRDHSSAVGDPIRVSPPAAGCGSSTSYATSFRCARARTGPSLACEWTSASGTPAC